MLVLEFIERLL